MRGIVFGQFSLGAGGGGIEIRQFWFRIGCNLPEKWQCLAESRSRRKSGVPL